MLKSVIAPRNPVRGCQNYMCNVTELLLRIKIASSCEGSCGREQHAQLCISFVRIDEYLARRINSTVVGQVYRARSSRTNLDVFVDLDRVLVDFCLFDEVFNPLPSSERWVLKFVKIP